MPEPERTEISRLLREYVDLRVRAVNEQKTDEAIQKSEAIHELLWQQATSAADKNQASIMTGVFIQSLNAVIDVHAKRVLVGLKSRLPIVIWVGLFGLSMLGMAAVGYQAALTTTRRSPAMIALVITFTFVLIMIADLDRTQEGLLRVSQQSMLDLQRSMEPSHANSAQSPAPNGIQ